MTIYCPHCGEESRETDRFCINCGEQLAETVRAAGETGRHQGRSNETAYGEEPVASGTQIPRKNAVSTFEQGFNWLLTIPIFLGLVFIYQFISILHLIDPGLQLPVLVLTTLLYAYVWGVAAVYVGKFVHEEAPGGWDGFVEASELVFSRILSLVGIILVTSVAVIIGLVLLILPGIYLAARLSFAIPICIFDEKPAMESLTSSWELAPGNILKIVGLLLIVFLPAVIIEFIATPLIVLLTVPVMAVLSGSVLLGIARVYLENRPGGIDGIRRSVSEDGQESRVTT